MTRAADRGSAVLRDDRRRPTPRAKPFEVADSKRSSRRASRPSRPSAGTFTLLSTPFRYGSPYPRGSRFRRPGHTPGVFHASHTPRAAIVEAAFHRLLFFAESRDTPWPDNPGEFTAFSVRYRSAAGLDLTVPPLDRDRAVWTHPTDYEPCQAFADAARSAAVAVLRYPSARNASSAAINIALLTCRAFACREPLERQTWRMHLGSAGVRAACAYPEAQVELPRDAFSNDPRVAAMQWTRKR